jgi:hypothetical protein
VGQVFFYTYCPPENRKTIELSLAMFSCDLPNSKIYKISNLENL